MKRIFLFYLAIFSFLTSNEMLAQKCQRYHAKNCRFHEKDAFQYSGQSRSGVFSIGQKSDFPVLAYGGYDYSISICYENKLGTVQFKVLEEDTKNVIYDNETDNYNKRKIFTVSTTKKLTLQIIVVGDADAEKNEANTGCLGVLIEYMKTPNVGF